MSNPVLESTVNGFLDQLASGAPTPGGGSVAGLAGAMAAGLIAMVCELTIGKKQYVDFEEEVRQILSRATELRLELQQLTEDDVRIFDRLSAAYKLPRASDADAATRKAAIQTVTRQASEVPLRIARAAVALVPLCAPLARHGNRSAVSDVGVAALMIRAAVPAALLNVEINLHVLEDQSYVRQARAQIEDLTVGLEDEVLGILEIVRERMAA